MTRKKQARRRTKIRAKSSSRSGSLQQAAYEAEPVEEFRFEMEPTVEAQVIEDFLVLLYGAPKIGKTTLASKLENPYFLATEPGFKFKKVRKDVIPNWRSFIAFVKKCEKKPKFCDSVGCFVVDTTDSLAIMCQLFVCGRDGIVHPSDWEWGKGWAALRQEFGHWVLRLAALGRGVMFISHEVSREIKDTGMKVDKFYPSMIKSCFDPLNELCDQIIRMTVSEKKNKKARRTQDVFQESRCLCTRNTSSQMAGDRLGILPGKIFFNTEEEALKKLRAYFDKYELE